MAKASTRDARATRKGGPRNAPAPAPEKWSIARRIAWWSLLAMVFTVPIAMGNFTFLQKLGFSVQLPITYDQFDIVKVFLQRVLGLVALGAWSWDILVNGGKIRRTPVEWLILAFLAWVTVSTMLSISPATAFFGKYRRFEGLLSFINYAVIYFLVLQFADRASRVKALAQALFWSSIVVSGYGLLQRFGADPISWGQLPFEQFRPFSTYGNPDLLGGFLMFSVPISLALALAEEKLGMRATYGVGFLLNTFILIVSFTRGAWIGGVIGIAVMAVIAWRHSVKWGWVDWAATGLTGALGLTAIIRSLSSTNEVMNFGSRFASIFNFSEGSGQTRTEIWQAAIAAIKHKPIFGFGADTFRLVFPKYKPIAYTKDAGYLSVADNVHDYPLQLAAGIGVVGMLLLYAIFVWAAVRSFKTVFGKSDDVRRIVLGGFWAAAAAYLVQLMFGLSVTGNSFLLWVAMAVVLAPTALTVEVKAPSWGLAAAAVVAVLAVLGISYQFVIMAADHQYLLSRVYYQGADRTQGAEEAAKLNPFNDMYKAEIGLAYTDQLVNDIGAGQQAQASGQDASQYTQRIPEEFSDAEQAYINVIKFVPSEYDNYVFLANLYNIGGQILGPSYYKKTIAIAEKGMQVEPYGPAIRVQLARALIATGKTDEAISQLRYSVKMDPAYTEPALLLADTLAGRGNKAEAIQVLQTLNSVNPGQAGVTETIQKLEASSATAP